MGSSSDNIPGIFSKSEELLELLRKGRTFAEELLRENERLRLRIVQLENAQLDAAADPEADRLRAENARLRERLGIFERRFSDVEKVNHDFANRYIEVERQNEALANLYVAGYQLHSTLEPKEVVEAISEIVSGLVGAAEFALLLVDSETNQLTLASGEGVGDRFPAGKLAIGEGLEGRVAASHEAFFGEPGAADEQVACVPLLLKSECVGVIGIYRMLSQKESAYTAIDHELLNLLAGQAATALVSSRLYAARERR